MAVLTFNPSWDGIARYTEAAPGASWATIRGAANATAIDDTGDSKSINIGGLTQFPPGTNKWGSFTRAIEVYDTAPIPDTAVITSVTLRWLILQKSLSDVAATMSIVSATTANDNFISVQDYNITGWGSSKYCTDITINDTIPDNYLITSFNATGIAAINKTGLTKIGLIMTKDLEDAEPLMSTDYLDLWALGSDNQLAIDNRPLLTVTYTLPYSLGAWGEITEPDFIYKKRRL